MKIKVGYLDYTVRAMGPVAMEAEPNTYGMCEDWSQTIYIRPDQTPANQGATLLHELLHALFRTYLLPREGLTEEDVCSKLEVPLAILIRDNPSLLRVLRDAVEFEAPIVTDPPAAAPPAMTISHIAGDPRWLSKMVQP